MSRTCGWSGLANRRLDHAITEVVCKGFFASDFRHPEYFLEV